MRSSSPIVFSSFLASVSLSGRMSDAILRRCSSNLSTLISSSLLLKGFVRYASAPASSPQSLSSSVIFAVTITIGICATLSSPLSLRHISYPSITGIITSLMMMSGIASFALSSPSCPFSAYSTLYLSSSSSPIYCATLLLSSTTSTVYSFPLFLSAFCFVMSSDSVFSTMTGAAVISKCRFTLFFTGMQIWNVVPYPTLLSTLISPPRAFTAYCTMGSPMPVPIYSFPFSD